MRGYFDGLARDWTDRYARREDYRERSRVFSKAIEKVFARSKIGRVLEIGCGAYSMFDPGTHAGVECYAADISFEMLKKNTGAAHFFQADFMRLPLRDPFDLVILSSVVEWLGRPLAVPGIASTLVRPGGFLLVSYPNARSLIRLLERNVVRPAKQLLRRRHYTDLQAAADYGELAGEFAKQRFALRDVVYFGKKIVVNSRHTSSLQLDTYEKA
ncbi:MAG: class I SAM-dependent methyltransferase [Pseudomonadota bacterium]